VASASAAAADPADLEEAVPQAPQDRWGREGPVSGSLGADGVLVQGAALQGLGRSASAWVSSHGEVSVPEGAERAIAPAP
jgi:hypothetical protein